MKKSILLLGASLSLFLISCEGPAGPPGLNGRDGDNGVDGIQGQVFEVNGVNLDYSSTDGLWSTALGFTDYTSFEIRAEDAILVYRFDNVAGFDDGTELNSWGLLPQNFFFEEGTMQYVTSHTSRDVQILIDGNFDLSGISTDYTDDQVFRVVIVPSVPALNAKMDKSNIGSVMSSLGVTESDVRKIKL